MTDRKRGRTILENLVEYPLPDRRPAVRDYVFNFVKPQAQDAQVLDYGGTARAFFKKWYVNHFKHDVDSLEEMVKVLHTDVTHGVTQIREIVMVSHANSQALLFHILAANTADNIQTFPYVNHVTLARLQKAFEDGKFQVFNDQRKRVVASLSNDSWVTIRACNFGNSSEGMYATYSFFGGRANVYAPMLFQLFGIYSMSEFRSLDSYDKLYSHLTHQHFLPKERTPERKRAILDELVEPARLSRPFKLVSRKLSNPTPEEKAAYESLLDDLNARKKSPALMAKMAEMMATMSLPDVTISDDARMSVIEPNAAWRISDKHTHEGIDYHLLYWFSEKLDDGRATLSVQAELSLDKVEAPKRSPPPDRFQVEIQLFLSDEQDDTYYGRVHFLATYTDVDQDTENQKRFAEVLRLLQTKTYAGEGVSIKEEFQTGLGVELPSEPNWVELDSGKIWKLSALQTDRSYLIKVEHPATRYGIQQHTIAVYRVRSEKEAIEDVTYLMDYSHHPDTPGTELAAYFDRFTLDELDSVVAHLRTPFKPGNSLYIDHAQQAMRRKKGFDKWILEQHPELLLQPLSDPSQSSLTEWEKDDKRGNSYEFDFNSIWAEVKASMPSPTAFQKDLFDEEKLTKALNIEVNDDPLPVLESDVRLFDLMKQNNFEAHFATDPPVMGKRIVNVPDESCREFETVITEVMTVKDLDVDEIVKQLEEKKTSGGKSYLDVAITVAKHYSTVRKMAKWVDLWVQFGKAPNKYELPAVPTDLEGLVKEVVRRHLEPEVKAAAERWLAGKGSVVISTTMQQTGLAVLWAFSVIDIPRKMLEHIAKEWATAEERWEAKAQLVAMRQWLRRVEDITYKAETVPDLHEIDVATPVSTMPSFKALYFANYPYYSGRYFLELYEEDPSRIPIPLEINAPERLKKGFDQGVNIMKFKVADELVRNAERGINEALRQWGFDSCKIRVLIKAGILDIPSLQAHLIGRLARTVLDRLPRA